ncbi:hypothetical protein BGZ97_008749 [Linnemannia gamsii]|uniref:Uncharacterized protein n=1 Tax=Linnemannia gamsii TaxID=64522 RepID=A0A9P6RD13_9FUNG|nr:hypothetical protein BGZ97_008749 [Linnemannia gamsii]
MGVGQGTVDLYTWKCFEVIEELEDQYIVWPDSVRKTVISNWFKTEKAFPNAFGALDGLSAITKANLRLYPRAMLDP